MFRLSAAPIVWVAWLVAGEIAWTSKWRSVSSEMPRGTKNKQGPFYGLQFAAALNSPDEILGGIRIELESLF
jgi:hypothetical protein